LNRLLGYNFTDVGGLAVIVSAGGIALVPSLLPAPMRACMLASIRAVFEQRSTFILFAVVSAACVLSTFVSEYDVRWTGPDTLELQVNGRSRTVVSSSGNRQQQSARFFGLVGERISLNANGFEWTERLSLLRPTTIDVPIYATSALSPRLAGLESGLLMSFLPPVRPTGASLHQGAA
jgi:hypothetical protein